MTRNDMLREADVIFSINPPDKTVLPALKVKFLKAANAEGVTAIDTTAVPRITIAQKLDVLSSQAKLAGHRAVLEAATTFGRMFGGEVTAAGKYPPCHTFVLGVGVAGLQAIGSAKALGSPVH